MRNKTFLLMMPDYSDFPNLFVENLRKAGFTPYLITDNPSKFKYKGIEKAINFFQKTFHNNREYKKKLVADHKLKEYHKKISRFEMLDYALVIRPDQFPVSTIQEMKKKTKKLIAYQWDGIDKFPAVKNYFHLFDSFFCFDSGDEHNNIKPTTNFYFDFIPPVYRDFNYDRPKFYFVGLYWQSREEKIDHFIDEMAHREVELSILIQYNKKSEIKNPKISYIKDRISFAENLENVIEADVLLDFVDPIHEGLSIRFFEGLYYKKKVITDNKMVRNYDFYHPQNIFILKDNNFDDIDAFLQTAYRELPVDIVNKYGFSRWIEQIITN